MTAAMQTSKWYINILSLFVIAHTILYFRTLNCYYNKTCTLTKQNSVLCPYIQ